MPSNSPDSTQQTVYFLHFSDRKSFESPISATTRVPKDDETTAEGHTHHHHNGKGFHLFCTFDGPPSIDDVISASVPEEHRTESESSIATMMVQSLFDSAVRKQIQAMQPGEAFVCGNPFLVCQIHCCHLSPTAAGLMKHIKAE